MSFRRKIENARLGAYRLALVPLRTRILPWFAARRWQLAVLFVGVLIPLYVFGSLADEVVEQESFFFDTPLLLFMQQSATPLLDQFMLFLSLVGHRFGVVPGAVVIFLLLLNRRRWGDLLFWTLAMGGAGILNLAAKAWFGRIRPNLWFSIAPEYTYSFPSGHAMGSMAFAAALVVLLWPTRWRWPAMILGGLFTFLVGLSRVYLGVHYPSDIVAGWAAALAWVLGVSVLLYGRAAKTTPEMEPTRTS
jgi:membrane-associated phospholipid phosphatase